MGRCQYEPDAFVAAPDPALATMQAVAVATHLVPTGASPLLQGAQPVQVSADAAGPAPEPATRSVVMVALEQGPV